MLAYKREAAVSGEAVRPKRKPGCVRLGRDVCRAAPGWQAQGLAPGGRRDQLVTSSMEFFFSRQPQEMLKRMVVYQTAFRQVKRYPPCVCGPPCPSLCLPL